MDASVFGHRIAKHVPGVLSMSLQGAAAAVLKVFLLVRLTEFVAVTPNKLTGDNRRGRLGSVGNVRLAFRFHIGGVSLRPFSGLLNIGVRYLGRISTSRTPSLLPRLPMDRTAQVSECVLRVPSLPLVLPESPGQMLRLGSPLLS